MRKQRVGVKGRSWLRRRSAFGKYEVTKGMNLSGRPGPAAEPMSAARALAGGSRSGWWPVVSLMAVVALFLAFECLLPLRTAIQIGADEGFNLAKATLCLKGHKLYSEVWSDQPPLHTFLITQILRRVSPSILGPRLVTAGFAAVLLVSVFWIALRIGGLVGATLATTLLMASPGFLQLSSSCMLEIPGLAPAVAALAVLLAAARRGLRAPPSAFAGCHSVRWRVREMIAGALFGIAFEMKPNGVPLLLVVGLILGLQYRRAGSSFRGTLLLSLLAFLSSLAITYIAIGSVIGNGAYFAHFKQSWVSHIAAAQSAEYGSAADYPFDWSILLKNWDTTIPALLGILVCLRQIHEKPLGIISVAWLVVSLSVFGTHKPWWPYYYIHIAIPLCLCGGIGIVFSVQRVRARRKRPAFALLAAYALCAAAWMGGRVYLQITGIRNSPQVYSELVLTEIERLKPFTKYMYASEPVYSFHAGMPMPPNLAVISLKRMWSGEMTNARIAEEMRAIKPGLILVANDSRELPFSDLIQAEYRLIYQDSNHNLYANRSLLIDARGKGSFE